MGLKETRKLIDKLISIEEKSRDINQAVLASWIHRTAYISQHGAYMPCPCCFPNMGSLHLNCQDHCAICQYSDLFIDIKYAVYSLNFKDQMEACVYLSSKLNEIYSNLRRAGLKE